MSMSNATPTERALKFEWLVMRIVVIGGCVVAIAIAVWFG